MALTARVHQGAVIDSQFLVGTIDLGIVEVGMQDPCFEIIDDQKNGHATEKGERGHVRLGQGLLIHLNGDEDEHVAAMGKDHNESPQAKPLTGGRIEPGAEIAVIDLSLLAWRRIITQNRWLRSTWAIGDITIEITAKTTQGSFQSQFIVKALPDSAGTVSGQSSDNSL